jgi:L-histidine Nalpha-methyltransferase
MLPSHARFTLIAMDASARLSAFARDVKKGLSAHPKHLSCCYFYDAEGSNLFEEICEVPEYYPPKAETEILRAHSDGVVSRFSGPLSLVELGSGNAAKTRILIDAILQQQKELSYVPIDICRTVLEDSSLELLRDYPALRIVAVAGEYQDGLRHLQKETDCPKLILWLGSNVGNFHREEAAEFLAKIRETMKEADRLLIGVDLRKEKTILERAYDDSPGVTARFNLNLLTRINRELGGHFDLSKFQHRATYNEKIGRVEMYLDSLCDQTVTIDQIKMNVPFARDEPIHTENSYKYSPEEIDGLAAQAGFVVEGRWLDANKRFSENLFRPLGN